jgi:hypothetical protein
VGTLFFSTYGRNQPQRPGCLIFLLSIRPHFLASLRSHDVDGSVLIALTTQTRNQLKVFFRKLRGFLAPRLKPLHWPGALTRRSALCKADVRRLAHGLIALFFALLRPDNTRACEGKLSYAHENLRATNDRFSV